MTEPSLAAAVNAYVLATGNTRVRALAKTRPDYAAIIVGLSPPVVPRAEIVSPLRSAASRLRSRPPRPVDPAACPYGTPDGLRIVCHARRGGCSCNDRRLSDPDWCRLCLRRSWFPDPGGAP